jgi:hypothetical protein
MNSELLASGWYPDPTGQPGQKYWDSQTWGISMQPFGTDPQDAHV